MEAICQECRRPLNYVQRKHGAKYCSHKCSNRANGRKARGVPRTSIYRANGRG